MRTVQGDFSRLRTKSGLGLTVFLGAEDRRPELASLTPGEHVLVVEPGEVHGGGRSAKLKGPAQDKATRKPGKSPPVTPS